MTFDQYATDYDTHLNRGIRLSGEDKEYFARGRLHLVRDFFTRSGFEPRRILEFGCGVGTNLGIMRDFWPKSDLVGLDLSQASIAIARERLGSRGVRPMTPDEYRLGDEGPVDWLFCNGVLHHVPMAERGSVLLRIRDLVREGGALTIFENNPLNPGTHLVMRRIPFDRGARMLRPYSLRSRLRSLGFAQVTCRFLFFFPRFLAFLRPMEPHLVHLPFGAQYGVFAFRAGRESGPATRTDPVSRHR